MKASFILIALLAQLVACNRSANPTSSPPGSPQTTVVQEKRDPLELTAIEIHKVRLDYPHKLREAEGKERVYEQAWLILFSFKNLGPPRDTAMNLFIGDYRIPEYAGFQEGIYFRIYEERLMESLDGQEVSVGSAGKKMKSLGKRFYTQGYQNLSLEKESTVLKR